MNKSRRFIYGINQHGTNLLLFLLGTDGIKSEVEIPKEAANTLPLLGSCPIFAFSEGDEYNAKAMQLEPNVSAYFPEETLFHFTDPVNLDKITNVHRQWIAQAMPLPWPFEKAGVQLPSGDVVGFQSGADLTQLLGEPLLWTVGEDSETQAIVELIPEHWWIEQIQEHSEGVTVTLWTAEARTELNFTSVEALRKALGVRIVTADLIGEAVKDTEDHSSVHLLEGFRRGVPKPYFEVHSTPLDPDTLWHYAKVVNDTVVEVEGVHFTLKEPIDSSTYENMLVSPSMLVL